MDDTVFRGGQGAIQDLMAQWESGLRRRISRNGGPQLGSDETEFQTVRTTGPYVMPQWPFRELPAYRFHEGFRRGRGHKIDLVPCGLCLGYRYHDYLGLFPGPGALMISSEQCFFKNELSDAEPQSL